MVILRSLIKPRAIVAQQCLVYPGVHCDSAGPHGSMLHCDTEGHHVTELPLRLRGALWNQRAIVTLLNLREPRFQCGRKETIVILRSPRVHCATSRCHVTKAPL